MVATWIAGALGLFGCGSGGDSSSSSSAAPVAPVAPSAVTIPTVGIVRLEISSDELAFEGRVFGTVGTYRKLRGKAYGELDPTDPRNALITDLALAPRNARGHVEYVTDFYILKPTDAGRGNHKLFFEVNNRGAKLFGALNQSWGGNDPTTAEQAGQAFLMMQGYTLAWCGWDPSAGAVGDNLTIQVPTAKLADGSTVTGPNYEYYSFDDPGFEVAGLSYPTASRDQAQAVLTVRDRLADTPQIIAASGWTYASDSGISLLPAGTTFRTNAIYEFTYVARDPNVAGIGFAATRDFVALLRSAPGASLPTTNPLGGDVTRVLAHAVSQPARYLNDFVWLGFNEDLRGAKVFDGILNWLGSGTGVGLNYRFAQPSRTERLRMNHLFPEARFPFAWAVTSDAFTGTMDGRLRRCLLSHTCPKVMSVNSANEYWAKTASLAHTDTAGHDLPDPDQVRFYMLSGVEHTVSGSAVDSAGMCAQPRSTVAPDGALRALFVALDLWVDGIEPPPSAVPREADGTAAYSDPTADSRVGVGRVAQAVLGWPTIPGVAYTGVITVRELLDFGPQADQGIATLRPPRVTGNVYPSFVSKVDRDGNEIAGIRLPPVAAPIATYSGWGLRALAFGGPDGCEGSGQAITFRRSAQPASAGADPRTSLAERYLDQPGYVAAVTNAARALQQRRLLLQADADAYIAAAKTSSVLGP